MRFSIIIPVLNEQNIINNTIQYLRNFKGIEIIVVDGNPEGSTINKIKDDDIIKLISVKGRSIQMNYGAIHATTNILIFLHADTKLPKVALEKITNAINKGFSAGAFNLKFDSNNVWIKIIEKLNKVRYTLTKTHYGDQAHFFTKKLFQKINGYPNIELMEDLQMMKQLKKKALLSPAVLTSARRFQKDGNTYHPLRIGILLLLYYIGVAPSSLKRFYSD